jgi:NhaC family Na+:H+ antiporter
MDSKSIDTKKEISLWLASIPMIAMGVFVGVGNLWMEIDLKFILLISTLVAGIVAYVVGVSVKEMVESIASTVKKAFPVILILIAIGGIVGTWMYSGTVPYLIYYGLKLLHPDYLLVTAFIVTATVSTFTGTSWGSAATAGVAFMGIGISMGVPLPMVAGAVISGAVFGDKVSPVSDTTNICAMSAEIPVYDHIRGMLPNVLISGGLAIIAFLILGLMNGGEAGVNHGALKVMSALDGMYNFNPVMLIPPIIVFAGGYKGYNPIVLMISSCIAAIIIGMALNGFSIQDGAKSMISGFNMEMTDFSAIKNLSAEVPQTTDAWHIPPIKTPMNVMNVLTTLLNRGGFEGMMSGAVLFCILAIAFGAIMEVSGALNKLMHLLLKGVKSSFRLIVSAFVSGALLNGITGNAMFSILTVGQLFRDSFKERDIPLPMLSRSMENSMTLFESLIPWHVTAIYMAATLEIDTLSYAPYAFFNMAGIGLFFILSYRTVKKLKL